MYIANVFCVCYNVCRLNVMSRCHSGINKKTPFEILQYLSGGFSWFYSLARLGCVAGLLAIQPFADAIDDHTSHNGENKCYEHFHSGITPFLVCQAGSGNRNVIPLNFLFWKKNVIERNKYLI